MTGPRSPVDWDQAFEYYAALGTVRSFGKVARRFGVSDVAVGQRARRHGWAERVAALDAETRRRVDARVVRAREVRLADTIELIDLARLEILEKLRSGDGDVKLADLPGLIKLEALIEGEPTDRVAYPELQQAMRQVFELAARFVPRERRAEFVDASLELLEGERPAIEGRATRSEEGDRS